MSNIQPVNSLVLMPQNMTEMMHFARIVADSDMVPKDYKGRPGNVLVAVQWGAELGLSPLQSLQNISLIGGRAAVWGDTMLALVQSSGLLEYIHEEQEEAGAVCRIKRKGQPEAIRRFTVEQAKQAGLWKKAGPWQQYPERMLQMRARSWALRDVFPDVLRGISIAEEAQDIPQDEPQHVGNVQSSREQPGLPPAQDELSTLKKRIWHEAKALGWDKDGINQFCLIHVGQAAQHLDVDTAQIVLEGIKTLQIEDSGVEDIEAEELPPEADERDPLAQKLAAEFRAQEVGAGA